MNVLLRRHGDLLLTALIVVVFTVWPELDLRAVDPFYQPGYGFPAGQTPWIKVIYEVVARLWILALVFVVLLLAGFVPGLRLRWARRRMALLYLLASLVLGPGLIVNGALKDHWGRPRPVHLQRYGGTATFVPALVPNDQCRRNCAFASGHAAAAFFPMAGYWITRRRRWLAGGIAFGLFVGVLRIAMGAHFPSDVLFAGLIVYFSCRALARLFRLHAAPAVRNGHVRTDAAAAVNTSDAS